MRQIVFLEMTSLIPLVDKAKKSAINRCMFTLVDKLKVQLNVHILSLKHVDSL